MSNIKDKLAYAYIKQIKRWMECPVCHDKMTFNTNQKSWICQKCAYIISEEEFLDDFVLWFCDECNTYLNVQKGFDKMARKHICRECGYENDTTFENIKGECKDCGKILDNPDVTLCEDCKSARKQIANDWLIKAGKVIGTVATVAGVAYMAYKSSEQNSEEDTLDCDWNSAEKDTSDIGYPICKTCGEEMTEFDSWAWYTCPECGNRVRIIDGIVTWYDEIFTPGKKDFKSDFELADFCHGGDLTEE